MDGQNFQNEQNTNVESAQQNFYQDNTTAQPVSSVVDEAPAKKNDALAIVSLIMGILAILLGCCSAYIGIIPGVVGIICSVISKKDNGKSGMATAGMVCSIIGIIIGIIVTILAFVAGFAIGMAGIDPSTLY